MNNITPLKCMLRGSALWLLLGTVAQALAAHNCVAELLFRDIPDQAQLLSSGHPNLASSEAVA